MANSSEHSNQRPLFKASWSKIPIFRDWIESVQDKPTKAYCKFCKCLLYAHHYSIIKHASTSKHQENTQKFQLSSKSSQFPKREKKFRINKKELTSNEGSDAEVIEKNLGNEIIVVESEDFNEMFEFDDVIEEEHLEEEDIDEEVISKENDKNYWSAEECIQYKEGEVVLETVSPKRCNIIELKGTITTHILDTTLGFPVANIPVTLSYLENNKWKQINRLMTNSVGRCPEFIDNRWDFKEGCYKLHFDVLAYLKSTTKKFLYPFIEVTFQCEENQHYHIALLLNPFGYSTHTEVQVRNLNLS